jgi:predicted unusual protein kinase regulating ubiquinone biosynthesis (AarF/ABC1/UbiB family)
MRNFFTRLLTDEKGCVSSKRLSGLICVIFLNVTLIANSFSHGDIKPSDILVETVGLLAFGALGLTSTEKIFGKKNTEDK